MREMRAARSDKPWGGHLGHMSTRPGADLGGDEKSVTTSLLKNAGLGGAAPGAWCGETRVHKMMMGTQGRGEVRAGRRVWHLQGKEEGVKQENGARSRERLRMGVGDSGLGRRPGAVVDDEAGGWVALPCPISGQAGTHPLCV